MTTEDGATDTEINAELDELSHRMLQMLAEHGGQANTSEIRSQLGLEDDDSGWQKIHYRVDTHLEPEGLVETHQPDAEPGNNPPKQHILTDAGREYIENRKLDASGGDVADERIQELEQRVARLEADNQKLVNTLEAYQNRLEDVESTADKLTEHPLIESPKGIKAINDALVSSQVVSLLLSKSDDIQFADGEREETQERVIERLWDANRLFETEAIVETVGVDES